MSTFQNIVAFGATSAICMATLRLFAKPGSNFYLIGRNMQKLKLCQQDLEARGASVSSHSIDFNNTSEIQQSLVDSKEKLKNIDLVIAAHGVLHPQAELDTDLALCLESIQTNYTSCALITVAAAQILEQQNHGTLAVFSSVAGDRGRKSNYFYGASKSAINTLLEGLDSRFHNQPINIVTIKPGMVDTPMTEDFEKGILWATPEQIAQAAYKGIIKGDRLIYAPKYWRSIMLVIRMIPRAIMARLSI